MDRAVLSHFIPQTTCVGYMHTHSLNELEYLVQENVWNHCPKMSIETTYIHRTMHFVSDIGCYAGLVKHSMWRPDVQCLGQKHCNACTYTGGHTSRCHLCIARGDNCLVRGTQPLRCALARTSFHTRDPSVSSNSHHTAIRLDRRTALLSTIPFLHIRCRVPNMHGGYIGPLIDVHIVSQWSSECSTRY